MPRQPRLALLTLLVMLAFGTAAGVGASSVLDRIFAWHLDLRQAQRAGRYHELNLSQTADGYTVTLHGATVDDRFLAIVYTVDVPPDGPVGGALALDKGLVGADGTTLRAVTTGSTALATPDGGVQQG